MPSPLDALKKASSIGPSKLPAASPYGEGVGQMSGAMPFAPPAGLLAALQGLAGIAPVAEAAAPVAAHATGNAIEAAAHLPPEFMSTVGMENAYNSARAGLEKAGDLQATKFPGYADALVRSYLSKVR